MSILLWLETTGLASALRASETLYAAVSTTHLVGLAVLGGTVLLLDLRLLGLLGQLPWAAATTLLPRLALLGIATSVASGLILFSGDAVDLAANPAFQAKIAVIAVAITNATVATLLLRPSSLPGPTAATRTVAATSLLCWVTVIALGRWIAFA